MGNQIIRNSWKSKTILNLMVDLVLYSGRLVKAIESMVIRLLGKYQHCFMDNFCGPPLRLLMPGVLVYLFGHLEKMVLSVFQWRP